MNVSRSIILSAIMLGGAVVLSGAVVAQSAGPVDMPSRSGLHARSWRSIDAGPQGVWAISNEGALFFCSAAAGSARPVCSGPAWPE